MSCNCALCSDNLSFNMPEEIIDAAMSNDLVLFCGAGISTENKNVLPYSFYTAIQNELNVKDNLSFSEMMQKYCDMPNGRRNLLKRIRERFNYIDSFPELKRQATAFHRELASIYQIKTIITTNWDTYFEDYCDAIPVTIPGDIALVDDKTRHVFKIHGSINNISSIVATAKDYEECYHRLQNGVIGANIKTLLANKTVVFIGFSFGDEDFSKIIEYLRAEMGDIYPHIYIVTIDKTLKDKLGYEHSTSIVTSGTFFLHTLKNILCDKGAIVNCNIEDMIQVALEVVRDLHEKVSRIKLDDYPDAIYCLFYQDGMIHAFERYIQMKKTGDYNQPCYVSGVVRKYDELIKECHKAGNYCDESYYEGYISGLIFIDVCSKEFDDLKLPHMIFLPNSKKDLTVLENFNKELERLSKSKSMYSKYAKEVVKEKYGDSMVLHHPPY